MKSAARVLRHAAVTFFNIGINALDAFSHVGGNYALRKWLWYKAGTLAHGQFSDPIPKDLRKLKELNMLHGPISSCYHAIICHGRGIWHISTNIGE
ncbi:unnamed protein product [Lactuca saligna]|uniref:Uncharacterized protein n=1 Tax=Lactuca saligna TaxID=75948 RepID=A0AA35UUU1_LACSI|nr:unnamed protein product [Lactuca saligna]